MKSPISKSFVLEVERKFCLLKASRLISNSGRPPFLKISYLGRQIIHDIYYDRSNLLSAAGLWVRQRNGQWEAKLRRGGDFTNSRFEELSSPCDISRHIMNITGHHHTEENRFGLVQMASFTTSRETWLADLEFKIVLDTMDFGHIVGEVELEQHISFGGSSQAHIEQLRQQRLQKMDDRITQFMDRYSWAFVLGQPVGKLTAYFDKQRKT